MSRIALWLLLFVTAAQAETRAERDELECFVLKSASACAHGFQNSAKTEDGRQFAEVGCLEIAAADSCFDLSEWHKATDPTARERYAGIACNLNSAPGCASLVELRHEQAAKSSTADWAKINQEVDTWTGKVCADDVHHHDLCQRTRTLAEEIHRRSDPSFGLCRLTFEPLSSNGEMGPETAFTAPENLSTLMHTDQCQRQCGDWLNTYRSVNGNEIKLRAKCLWSGKKLGRTLWRSLRVVRICSDKGMVLGAEDSPYYERCHCENLMHPELNDVAESSGAHVLGVVSVAKHLGRKEVFRCAASFHFDHPATDSHSPQCLQKVKELKLAAHKIKQAAQYELNFSSLQCSSPGAMK